MHMAIRRSSVQDDEMARPVVRDEMYAEEVDDRTSRPAMIWSPAQIVGLIVGLGFVILGVAALARTGFDTSHVYTPHDAVWNLWHSPLLGAIEIGFGALMIVASVVPGALRTLMALLGVIAFGFGLVVLLDVAPHRLNKWLAVTHRNGWLFLVVGAVVLLAAFFSPVFGSGSRRRTRYVNTAR
jgi:hypothetical protein